MYLLQLVASECESGDLGTNPSSSSGAGSVNVPNGMVTYNSLTPDSVATLICDPGYTVGSEQNRTCLSDGHWSDETLECVEVPLTDLGNIQLMFNIPYNGHCCLLI